MKNDKDKVKPPSHLRPETKKWFSSVLENYILEQHDVMLLTRCAEAWDRGEEARLEIKKYGLTVLDRFSIRKANPACAIERDCRTGVARILREMGLDIAGTPSEPKRPPALPSNRR